MKRSTVLFVVIIYVTTGCATGRNGSSSNNGDLVPSQATTSHCEPATSFPQTIAPVVSTGNEPSLSPRDEAALPSVFSGNARQIAQIIGVQDLIVQIPMLQDEIARNVEGATFRLLHVRQQFSDRLLLALFETSSIANELECEKARAEDVATLMDEVKNDVQQRRTILAILADSISGVFAGTFLLLGAEIISGVTDLVGSALALGFGYSAMGGDQHNQFLHSRNLLEQVWTGPEQSALFPASVWRFLNWTSSEDAPRSRREAIISSWRGRLGKAGSETERRRVEIFFGKGGVYQVDELRYRGEMLGLLKAYVNLMSQDLNLLFRETLDHLTKLTRVAQSPEVKSSNPQ